MSREPDPEDKPAPAADDLVARLRGERLSPKEAFSDTPLKHEAADRIEAQAREIAELKLALEDATHGISATLAKDELEAAQARAQGLAASLNNCVLRAAAEKARADRLASELKRHIEGWSNAVELSLLPDRHIATAVALRDSGRAALASEGGDRG